MGLQQSALLPKQSHCRHWCSTSWPRRGLLLLLRLNTGRCRQHAGRRLHQLGCRWCSWQWRLQALAGTRSAGRDASRLSQAPA